MMPKLLRNTRSAGAREVSAPDAGSSLPPWPALPGRRQPDLDRVAEHLSDTLGVRAAMVSLVSAAGQVVPGASGGWDGGRSLPLAWPFCSEVRRTGRPLLVDDVRSWLHPDGTFGPVVPWLGAYAGVPLKDESGRAVGAVSALADRSRPWVPRDVTVLEATARLCRDLVRLGAAQVALEQCVAEATWGRRQARAAADRSEAELVRATADRERHRLVSAVADALAGVAGTATDPTEICAVVEVVLARHAGVAAVRWATPAPSAAVVGPWSVRLPVESQSAEPGVLVLEWPERSEPPAAYRDAFHRVAALVGQALDRMHLVRHWEAAARQIIEHF